VSGRPRHGAPGDEPEGRGGWESLAGEEGGSLAPSPELEEALREAAQAVEERGRAAHAREAAPAAPSAGEAGLAAELEATKDRLLRLHADFENFRRRAARERLEVEQYGHQNLVKELLTAVDNLERAIEHARRSGGGDLDSLLQGVELVRKDLATALGKHGVIAIPMRCRKPFDPACTRRWRRLPMTRWLRHGRRGAAEGLRAAGPPAAPGTRDRVAAERGRRRGR
jgi:molecular chaperone GrpE